MNRMKSRQGYTLLKLNPNGSVDLFALKDANIDTFDTSGGLNMWKDAVNFESFEITVNRIGIPDEHILLKEKL